MRAFLLAGLSFALATAAAGADDLKDLARDARTSVLHLRVLDAGDRELGSGTGFFVSSDGLLATNLHVVAPAHRIVAVPAEGAPLEIAGIVARDETHDLAVLRAAVARSRPLALATSALPDPGERIVVLGGPLGLAGSLSEGIVAAVRDTSEIESQPAQDTRLLQITAAISPGSSGSPVMKLDGEVVGVVVSQSRAGQNLNFAVPVAALHDLLGRIVPGTPAAPLGTLRAIDRGAYLRNLLISAVFFVILYVALKRMR